MSAAATSAIASGSSRAGGPKISARVSVITTRAATRSTTIELESLSASPSTTTGRAADHVLGVANARTPSSATAARIRSIASLRSDSLRSGFSRTRIWAASALGQKIENCGFGWPGLAGSKTTELTKVGSSSCGSPLWPVVDRELEQLLPEAVHHLGGAASAAACDLLVAEPLLARASRGGRGGGGLRLAARRPRICSPRTSSAWIADWLQEGGAAEHRLGGLLLGDLARRAPAPARR